MTSGAAVGLFNVLKAYVERDRSVSFTVEKPDGSKTTLTAASLKDAKSPKDALQEDSLL